MELKDLFKEHTDAVEERLKELGVNITETKARLDDVEQKSARRGGGEDGSETKSWGAQFIESAGLAAFSDEMSRPGRFRLDIKANITTGGTSGGPLGLPSFRDGLNNIPQRRMQVRDLLPVIGISSGSVEYPQQTTRTNAAAPVAEGAVKPESAYGWTMQTVNPKVIAHWVPASRQILDDAPQLRGVIDTELRYGLALKEEEQLLNGSGTGENLNGLVTNATPYAAPIDPAGSETMLDTIALAILQSALAEEPADGAVIHPSDWMRMRLLKDADGKYILGDPAASVPPVLFGLPVVATQAMTVDKFLVGNFQRAATIYDRWSPRVEVSTEHADFFTRNMVAILCEERLAQAIKNAAALTYGDFGNIT